MGRQAWFTLVIIFGFISFTLFITFLVLYLTKGNDPNPSSSSNLSSANDSSISNNRHTDSDDPLKNEFVTVALEGGLGNQLFEVATAYAYARKTGRHFVLNHNMKTVSAGSPTPRPTYFKNTFQWTAHDSLENRSWHDWTEPSFRYTEIPSLSGSNIKLKGYFQSPKYFQDYRPELIQKLTTPDLLRNVSPFPKVAGYPTVSLHVRRADYLGISLFAKLPLSYYQRAIEHLQKNVSPNLQLIIFSDDLPWCHANLQSWATDQLKLYFIDEQPEKLTDEQELFCMSTCDHHIIANSSFSWWGAYLDPKGCLDPKSQSDSVTIAPREWFTSTHDWQDIYVPEWIVL
jgi:hypothetical protein